MSHLASIPRPPGAPERRRCWRAECRASFGAWRTVIEWPSLILAYCHVAAYRGRGLDFRADVAAHADLAGRLSLADRPLSPDWQFHELPPR